MINTYAITAGKVTNRTGAIMTAYALASCVRGRVMRYSPIFSFVIAR